MRQFLYLDTDIVNSIIAQDGKGLIDAFTTEKEKGVAEGNTTESTIELKGEAGASVLKLAKAEASLELKRNIEENLSKHDESKEIIAKTLHDAAFDMAYEVISPLLIECGEDEATPGDYIEMERVFDFIDLNYLEKIFSKDGIIDYIKKMEKEKIDKEADEYLSNNLNRDQRRHNEGKIVSGKVNELKKNCDKQYDDLHSIIVAISKIIPYGRMLVSNDGYLIPVEEKYFRVNPVSLGFMYGGQIKCVGMITNIIGETCNGNDSSNVFASLQSTINGVLKQILPTNKENIFVVSPIAIYYEK